MNRDKPKINIQKH